jgi:hypothetical protein
MNAAERTVVAVRNAGQSTESAATVTISATTHMRRKTISSAGGAGIDGIG